MGLPLPGPYGYAGANDRKRESIDEDVEVFSRWERQKYTADTRSSVAPPGVPTPSTVARSAPNLVLPLAIISLLLAAIVVTNIVQIARLNEEIALAKRPRYSEQTRREIQQAVDTTNKVLGSIGSEYRTSVYLSPSTDSAPKQQVAAQQYIFDMQRLLALQNEAILRGMLDQP